ncbi:MAG: DUF1223 domain-containing protein [Paracoccaceae bacterium]
MNRIISAAAIWLAGAASAYAQSAPDNPVVVELYTSQGCSSCPPADAILATLAQREDVIALALHVDYWDYIGWADSFANPAFTMRQKAYAAAAGARSIYTPQMVVGGTDHVTGAKSAELSALIRAHARLKSPVTMTVTRDGDVLHIRAQAAPPLRKGALVQIVRYLPKASVSIERGENAGRTIDYTHIVESWKPVAEWDGQGDLAVDTPASGPLPSVVIVQEPGPGAILAAVRLR